MSWSIYFRLKVRSTNIQHPGLDSNQPMLPSEVTDQPLYDWGIENRMDQYYNGGPPLTTSFVGHQQAIHEVY
jgi:hypothetical protein